MTIIFNIHYKTHFGQIMMFCASHDNSTEKNHPVEMQLIDADNGKWQLKYELKSEIKSVNYKYFVKDQNFATQINEWGENRKLILPNTKSEFYEVTDFWRSASDVDYSLFSSAFLNSIFKPEKIYPISTGKQTISKDEVLVRFQIAVSRVEKGDRVVIYGNTKELGDWKKDSVIPMSNENFPYWTSDIIIKKQNFPIKYKYGIYNEKNKKLIFDEAGLSRTLDLPSSKNGNETLIITDEKFNFPNTQWKGAGVAIPVFALRRKTGLGVGEFSDLKLLVDWAKRTGLKIIQVLPVNDTIATHTWMDSYPYSGISVFALHPMYINLMQIGKLSSKITQQIVEEQGNYLNTLEKIDYEAVMRLKSRFFKQIYDEQNRSFLLEKEYETFFNENQHWLRPYAAFSYLRDLFNTADFNRWGKYKNLNQPLLDEITDEKSSHFDDIAIHYFIQYHAHKQLLDAAEYARQNGIVLKGDIPIGIYRNSVDAWIEPHLYNMDSQAGAPPDDFSAKGQNWKFPTYNWQEMSKDGYKWWQKRLQKMSDYFDAFRIDHILGFFRIWEIPGEQVEGLMGYFNPSLALTINELSQKGMWFNYDRLCLPYIRQHFLGEFFGIYTNEVKDRFLYEYAPGCFYFKPEFNTQKKIEQALALGPDASYELRTKNEQIKLGLFSLISEVIFLETPSSDRQLFYPRNSFHFTKSYQELDEYSKEKLNEIYIDYFYRRNENFWAQQAMIKLPAIKEATNMLLCGEDLGMVPDCVPDVMRKLAILSLEIQRMPKQRNLKFAHPADYPYLSVATPSSHDTSTIRGWWEESPARSQEFYNQILGNYGNSPFYCEYWIVQQIINQHMYSPSMLAIFPIQDLLGMDDRIKYNNAQEERINQPANPNHYWRYRLHICLEDLLNQEDFNNLILNMIKESGRYSAY